MKYLQNKYTTIYFDIIENRKAHPLLNSYTENHHILPDSMGGSDESFNMVHLSAREHFLCHYLLTKMIDPYSANWYKMVKAFMMMKSSSENQNRYFNSRLYESKKKEFSQAQSECQSGKKNSQYGTTWIFNEELNITKKIKTDDLNVWIKNGWINRKKSELYNHICTNCNNDFKNKQKIRKSRNSFCSDTCRYNYKTIHQQLLASELYYKFIHGDYSSVREFCRTDCDVSHVAVMKKFKKYIIGFESFQGKSLN